MPKQHRFTHTDFSKEKSHKIVRKNGRYFMLHYWKSPTGVSKVACVVSKKVAKTAVARNKLQRWCRETMRPLIITLSQPTLLVFIAKKEASSASYRDIQSDVRALFAEMAQ